MIGNQSYHFHQVGQGPDLTRPRPFSQKKDRMQTVLTYAVTVPRPVTVPAPVVFVQSVTVPSSSNLDVQEAHYIRLIL